MRSTYLPQSSWLSEHIVKGISWHPNHGRERDDKAQGLSPLGELIISVGHGLVADDIIEEDALEHEKVEKGQINKVFATLFYLTTRDVKSSLRP